MAGWVAIHLGRGRVDSDQLKMLRANIPDLPASSTLPLGAIVGAAFVERSVRLDELRRSCGCGAGCNLAVGGKHDGGCSLSPFAQGPFCNVISAVIRFAHPIALPGDVNQWEIPPEVRVAVQHVLSQPWALTVKYNRKNEEDLPRRSPLPWLGPCPAIRGESLDAEPPQRTSCTKCGSTSTSFKDSVGRQRGVSGMCKRCYAVFWRDAKRSKVLPC